MIASATARQVPAPVVPLVAPSRDDLATSLAGARRRGARIALVPTM